jgi:hypothetical protein
MFKKLLLAGLAFFIATGICFAAVATVTPTEYGFSITGGTTATELIADTWTTTTAYLVGHRAIESQVTYECVVAHTSGTFATDFSSGYWVARRNVVVILSGWAQKAASATDTTTLVSGATGVSATSVPAAAILNTDSQDFGSEGLMLTNPRITLANANDIIYLRVRAVEY